MEALHLFSTAQSGTKVSPRRHRRAAVRKQAPPTIFRLLVGLNPITGLGFRVRFLFRVDVEGIELGRRFSTSGLLGLGFRGFYRV